MTLLNAAHARLAQVWKTTTREDGRYMVWIRPRISGVIVVGYSGSATVQSVSVAARERVRVVPIIRAQFTASRTPDGFINPIVHGRFLPARGAPVTLAWQARIPGGRWQLIGPLAATVRPKIDGTFFGQLRVGPFDAHAELRLVYLGISGGPYATASSPAQRLR